MKLAGDYLFEASVQDVWDALFDPAVLAAAMPGCEKLDVVDGDYVGVMTIKIGPISGKFTGKVRLEDKDEPKRYRMIVDGRGGPGFVKATATIALAPEGNATRLTYDADAQIGGKIASVGERLVDASARAITKQSLDGLHENIKIRAAHHAATRAATPERDGASGPGAAAVGGVSPGELSTGASTGAAAVGESSTGSSKAASSPGELTAGASTGTSSTGTSPTGASSSGASSSGASSMGASSTGSSTGTSSTGASSTGASNAAATGATPTAATTTGAPGPVYKRADAGQMAKTVAAATFKTLLPVIVAIAIGIAIVVWLIVR